MSDHEPLAWHTKVGAVFALLFALFVLTARWLWHLVVGEAEPIIRLSLTETEMHTLERACQKDGAVVINEKPATLASFEIDNEHVHPNCGSCPDELFIDSVKGKFSLLAQREQDSDLWKVVAMKPILGLFGGIGTSLTSLRVENESLGRQVADSK